MHTSRGIADGEMLSLGKPLKAAWAGHLEVVEQSGDENHQLCVSKAAKRTCQHWFSSSAAGEESTYFMPMHMREPLEKV